MKENFKGNKSIALTTAVSLLGSSCSGYLEPPEPKATNQTEKDNIEGLTRASRSISVSKSLNDDEYAYLNAIIRLTEDLISGHCNSYDILDDPQNMLLTYGYTGNITPDKDLLRILSAFGDSKFIEAINNHDVTEFIRIAKEKGLIQFDIDTTTPFNSNIENLPESTKNLIAKLSEYRSVNTQSAKAPGISNEAISDWFVDSVAVAAVVVLVGIEVAVVVMVVGLAIQQDQTISESTPFSSKLALNRLLNAKQVDVWDVYIQKNGTADIYTFIDNRINELCDYTIMAIDEFAPEFWEQNSKVEVRNNLGLLFMNYLFECEK